MSRPIGTSSAPAGSPTRPGFFRALPRGAGSSTPRRLVPPARAIQKRHRLAGRGVRHGVTGLRLCNRASQEAASTLIRSRRDRTTGFGAGGGTDDRPFLSRQAVPDAQLFDGPFCANAGAPLAAIRDGLSILPSKPRRPRQEGGETRRQRRPRRAQGRPAGRLQRSVLPAVPVPPHAKRDGPRSQGRHAAGDRGQHPPLLRG